MGLMWKKLMDLVAPFASIAQELRIIRELYELELSQRPSPIIRITEKARRTDTEVTYADEVPHKTSALQKLKDEWDIIGESDD